MKLLVGLGNPGDRYAGNRHNVGFMAVEAIARRHDFGPWKKKFSALAADGEIAGQRAMLLKPDTYMNESGRAVGEACRFLKIAVGDVVAFHDELDLEPGKLKVKAGGGNAGHNGLRSMTAHIGNDYWRVRLGIGHPGSKDLVSHYVLSDFAKADRVWLERLLSAIADEAAQLVKGDDARFVMAVQRRLKPPAEEPAAAGPAGTPGRTREDVPGGRHPGDGPTAAAPRAKARPHTPHPAGERAGKRQSAIADNLRKWLAARDTSGGKDD
jgi:PTH1 family peptidyl-tRNA hydrolase